jgi:hypothetical protein
VRAPTVSRREQGQNVDTSLRSINTSKHQYADFPSRRHYDAA